MKVDKKAHFRKGDTGKIALIWGINNLFVIGRSPLKVRLPVKPLGIGVVPMSFLRPLIEQSRRAPHAKKIRFRIRRGCSIQLTSTTKIIIMKHFYKY